ncbi:MAG: hypothetical protein GEV08_02870 [Acidimicrobiia bacterium]|nr:hypothetical protein [Acidimicrobiia bacterium]
MKKGRHRRFEEARALKRSSDIDFDRLLDDLKKDDDEADELELDDEHDEDDDEVEDEEDARRP